MTQSELEVALSEAKERQKKAIKALSAKRKGGEMEEFHAATEALLQTERALAAAKGEEYAIEIDMPAWDIGAPLPHLFQTDNRTFLIFILRDADTNSEVTSEDVWRAGGRPDWLAVVTFQRCICTKMGSPNDEVFQGHPLHGKGFKGYSAMTVENSKWIRELEAINAVHRYYRPEAWRELKHYVLPFHDCTFECVACGFTMEKHLKGFHQLLSELSEGPVR
jgi:hypothetical protein